MLVCEMIYKQKSEIIPRLTFTEASHLINS